MLLCPLALQVHFTVSPCWIVTDSGEKTKPPLPTVTVTVAPLAAVGQRARIVVRVSTIPTMRSGESLFPFPLRFPGKLLASLRSKRPRCPLCEWWNSMAVIIFCFVTHARVSFQRKVTILLPSHGRPSCPLYPARYFAHKALD